MFPRHTKEDWLIKQLQIIVGLMPLFLIALSFSSIYSYYLTISVLPDSAVSDNHKLLPLDYILAFVFAEAAFVWMALREYLQDELGITDRELFRPVLLREPEN
jgi:hypothetical protein